MSIYATLGHFKYEWPYLSGEYVEIWVQSVPPHIGHPASGYAVDPYADFLPPLARDAQGDIPRAVVIVRDDDDAKDGQRYVHPLLVIPGEEWASLSWCAVMGRIEMALNDIEMALNDRSPASREG